MYFSFRYSKGTYIFALFFSDGAALLYTSTLHPYTFHSLREYILHRVLNTPSKPYSFHLKAQVIERDTVLVPSGWDSWGKIRILREGFDCDHVSEGWDADMDAVIDRQNPGNTGARGTYEESITNQELEIQVRKKKERLESSLHI